MDSALKILKKSEVEHTDWFLKSIKIAEVLSYFIQTKKEKISEVHKHKSPSSAIQQILLPKMIELGFESEKKGLFSDYKVSSLRPDYFLSLGEQKGIIMEVERGKTKANNMDLLDLWKCHICRTANCLFLIVPFVRQTEKGKSEKIFEPVFSRLDAFFQSENHVNVDAVFLFGY